MILEIVSMAVGWGTVAGLAMAAAMQVGSRLGWARVDLPMVDGRFFFGERFSALPTYLLGLAIHIPTSIGLAAGCFAAHRLLSAWLPVSPVIWTSGWIIALWLAFGLTVSPVVGLGWFGSKSGRWVWLELLVTHVVYGVVLGFLYFPR